MVLPCLGLEIRTLILSLFETDLDSIIRRISRVDDHDNLPEATYRAMMAAKSTGTTYGKLIKGTHPHRK